MDVENSLFQGRLSLEEKLERARTELLDLSARNKLLNIPRSKTAKSIDIIDERSEQIYRLLLQEGKAFTFLPGRSGKVNGETEAFPEDEYTDSDLQQPEDDESDELRAGHIDTKFQTRMTPKGLQTRLLDLYHDSRTLEEEQGVNILFLALGSLKWVDPKNKENIRFAPLVLLPVTLERGTAGERFKLRVRQEELLPNLSLESYLDKVHQLKLPTFDMGDDFDIVGYMSAIAKAVETKTDWAVQANDITLGFFSFAKFLMYRDLDPESWPSDSKITEQPIVRALLSDGFETYDTLISDDASIDLHIQPKEMLHIVDSDSSQTLAVHDVRKGRNIVIQGPPGTGKSQTIANVIASAIADGKTVLFVAEKMAALDVVKRRLDHAGVGDACLELHSNKANKRALLDELKRVWELGSPRGEFPDILLENLTASRDVLNEHARRLHEQYNPSELTPYQVMGQLVRLRRAGQQPVDISLVGALNWSSNSYHKRLELLTELTQRIHDIGLPDKHPWYGVGREEILPIEVERLIPRLSQQKQHVEALQSELKSLAETLEISPEPQTFSELNRLKTVAEIVAGAPSLSQNALTSPVWSSDIQAVRELISYGLQFQHDAAKLTDAITPKAIDIPLDSLDEALSKLPQDFSYSGFKAATVLKDLLPRLETEVSRLQKELGTKGVYQTFNDISRLIALADRVADAPEASSDAFIASVWDHGVEQASELVDAIATLELIRATLDTELLDIAWDTDVKAARIVLASQTGPLRFLSGEWRNARALGRSIIKNPKLPMPDLVKLLDGLLKGQAALSKIKEGNNFGQSAFGADWRGDRSKSEPLRALVEWMRTLRGFGAEPRVLVSQLADRNVVKARATQVNNLIVEVEPALNQLWDAYSLRVSDYFNDELSVERVILQRIEEQVDHLIWINELSHQVLQSPPQRIDEHSQLIMRIIELQALALKISDYDQLGRQAFDNVWQGVNSNWDECEQIATWIQQYSQYRFLAATLFNERYMLIESVEHLLNERESILTNIEKISDELQAKPEILFKSPSSELLSIQNLYETLHSWLVHSEQLSKWVAYQHRATNARNSGLAELVDRLSSGQLSLAEALPTMERAYYETILAYMVEQAPELARFDGELHSRLAMDFSTLDRQRIKAASIEVVRAHHRRIPSKEGGAGPVGILRGEMARKRGHMPIRQLMQKAGSAIQALKPVMMMSPLSVAQFLVPGRQTFDLLVMDEASQIQPVDAIGAIARCKQVVVVGDERQLPPTKFFAKMTESNPDDSDETTQVSDIESILGLFVARGLPQRMLRWHYRSRHQSLIAVSNSQFYENKLFIVPSPYTQEAGMGLQFYHIPEGIFESGGAGTNIIEAKHVAKAILQHAKNSPELSLGIATFSVSQRKAIQDELETLRRLNPDLENFFYSHPSEPFFVKNLENVQGDERDVIMISVGYAKNAQGYMAMRFGPLGAEGGERRLNVLISRAKRRCEVYASITDEDIDLERAKGKGVFAFKLFLQYARTGRLSVAQAGLREMDSVFEEQVADALQSAGYQVHPQVGIAGFYIDLGIADPDMPGRYLIGIECDGKSYHSSRSARERDRLRQAVLEDHGWIIHRIWSTDWFQRPDEQLQKTLNAIESAKIELATRLEQGAKSRRAVPVEIITVDRGPITEIGLVDVDSSTLSSKEYIEASPMRHSAYELHDTPVGLLADLVEQIVAIESPVHFSEVVTRLRTTWGLQRSGARIEAAVDQAVSVACSKGNIVREDSFLSIPGSSPVLRNRQGVQSAGIRKPEMIASQEIAAGIRQIIKNNLGATDDELVITVSRMLGFKSTSSTLRKVISDIIEELVANGTLYRDQMMIVESSSNKEAVRS
ncbi:MULTISPECIES: DUF3320 domain-containing protein [Yersinia pseudotuberculosis complex]|uniref:Uncharacterized protein n=2 Tax=Yersinia pseudotuberculosis complex TaxID=1649845 RepID=A0A0U1R1M3_YERP3|nr:MULTISPECIES: DUF3320 domain-containing protein [Yersinia pseudotuberculosis complex]ABS49108.1 conserved hypothetical protein [Yersinia pseudotuberculosis IP 31758]AJK15928.1 viral (Super1) RNA helicase family protein [Yersinia pseudotuberculosis str. PA3606]MCE4114268.1 DUF3320 domain-containing protein [Yersinia pseudotuberculosis]MCF1164557.1 DUF3320 domain-containing protein [Yersinia pseudotuberculosis]UFA60452.1 Superfamily I DNA/RNA helicase [Yersinia pseudotuberculosis]